MRYYVYYVSIFSYEYTIWRSLLSPFSYLCHMYSDQLRVSAWKSASIALACAASMIILTSHSATIMLLSVISIGYVLVATCACLVSLGWSLGLFESILFSIVIGIGCDFVLHFGHAYTSLPGTVSRGRRTRHALIHMGPSVLGSAFTTLTTALIMLSTFNTFSRKFATMLSLTIVHSTLGSFIVFLVLCDCIGPSSSWCWSGWPWRSQKKISSAGLEPATNTSVDEQVVKEIS